MELTILAFAKPRLTVSSTPPLPADDAPQKIVFFSVRELRPALRFNTFVGYATGPAAQLALNNTTAIGAYAEVDTSNSPVLGSIPAFNTCTAANNCASTNVGIGTTARPPTCCTFGNTGNPTGSGNNNFFRVEGPAVPGTNVGWRHRLEGGEISASTH